MPPKPPRILFLTLYDETGASARYMIYQYLEYFRAAGYLVEARPLLRGKKVYATLGAFADAKKALPFVITLGKVFFAYLTRYVHVIEAWSYDAVVIQKDVLPFGLGWLLFLGQKNVTFASDDPIWFGHSGSGVNVPVLGPLLAWYRRSLLLRILRGARLILVDNIRMKEFVVKYNANCEILDSSIDMAAYPNSSAKDAPLALGWIGSPSSSHLLRSLLPAIEEIAREIPIRLYNIGGERLQSSTIPIENIPWSHESEVRYLPKMTVGLMPMGVSDFDQYRFSRKWMMYACCETPTIATDTELNRSCISDGVTGMLYPHDRLDIFVTKTKELLKDSSFRRRLGIRVRENISANFSKHAIGNKFVQFMNKTLAGGV